MATPERDRTTPNPPGHGGPPRDAAPDADAPPPPSFVSYLRSLGPGIVVALSWVGTGDMVDNSVAGGNYGYALIWVLPFALLLRFIFVNTLAKYPLYNVHRDNSIVAGFGRLGGAYRIAMLIAFVIYAHILVSFSVSGFGEALYRLTGQLDNFWWALLGCASAFLVIWKNAYRILEITFKIILGVMAAAFVVGIVLVGINWSDFFAGFAFEMPEQRGVFDSGLVVSSLTLAMIGSMANLFYPEFLRDKGWTTPGHRRMQIYDLAFGTLAVFFLGVAMWAIAAEVTHRGGGTIDSADDIAAGLEGAIGPIGRYIFYVGLIGAAWTTIAASTFALARMTTESLHLVSPRRRARYADRPERDPAYHAAVVWALTGVVWSLPFAPDFVVLTVISHMLTSPFLVLIAIGLLILLNQRAHMGDRVNRWWENVLLGLMTVLVTVSAIQGLSGVWDTLSAVAN